ncbi:MAG: hypothetical protein ACLFN8_01655 [Candidatus Woesearchaeota archaeon]
MNSKKTSYLLKIKKFTKTNILFLILLLISTSYFIIENQTTTSWDLSVYVLNAKEIFQDSYYSEIGRPPLISIIIGIISLITGLKIAELIFIISTSILYAYAIYKFAKKLKYEPFVLYALGLNAYVLTQGLSVGTELLALTLLIITTTQILKNKETSGIYLGLMSLTRYTTIAMAPLLIFHYNIKKIIKSIILYSIIILTWLIYNLIEYGNLFQSIANQYALNILAREQTQPIQIQHFLETINILLPLILIGIFITINQIIKKIRLKQLKKYLKENKQELIMITILILVIQAYITTPHKYSRYLFLMTFPTIYYSYIGLNKLSDLIKTKSKITNKAKTKLKTILIISMFIISLGYSIYDLTNRETQTQYEQTKKQLEQLNLTHCQLASNNWPQLNYINVATKPSPRQQQLNQTINEGTIIALYKKTNEPEYTQNRTIMNHLPIIYENENIIILGNQNCTQKTKYTNSYLIELQTHIQNTKNISINTNPCFILFEKYGFAEKTCNLLNLQGFKLDQNRETW